VECPHISRGHPFSDNTNDVQRVFNLLDKAFDIQTTIGGWLEMQDVRPDFDINVFVDTITNVPSVSLMILIVQVKDCSPLTHIIQ
jgi:hypothetical protein